MYNAFVEMENISGFLHDNFNQILQQLSTDICSPIATHHRMYF